MVSYSTNFGNGSGSVLKIYGDQGVIDLTTGQRRPFSAGAAQARASSEARNAGRAGRDARPLPRLAPVPADAQDAECPDRGRLPACGAGLMAVRAIDTGNRTIYDAET